MTHDLIIRGVSLLDGTGTPPFTADLGVRGERISAIGSIAPVPGVAEIAGAGLALAPGFIDAHCHDDGALLTMPALTPKVSQGVTTVINGNCGISLAPTPPGRAPGPPPLNLVSRDGSNRFARFADYFAALRDQPPAVNSMCLVGHTSLRHAVMDDLSRPASAAEIDQMCALLAQALDDGVPGMSTGTFYAPAAAATTEELIALSRVMRECKGLYVTHMRNEADDIDASMQETFRIGTEAGVRVIISHHKCVGQANYGRSRATLAAIDKAREHQTVWLDAYPYAASSTILQAERVAAASRVLVTWSASTPEASARYLDDIAREWACSESEAAQRLMPGGAIYFQMDEADVQRILAYEHTMIGSDGIVLDEHPHPRAWGSFPRVLGHYARDLGLFSLSEAVRRMTSLPASRFGLTGRGVLAVGNFADLVLFDPQTIADVADFTRPTEPAAGIHTVINNGAIVWRNGQDTGARPGKVLLRPPA